MAFDAFLKIDGIPGESMDEQHPEWIEVLSFSHSIDQPASSTASSVGGATSERVNHRALKVIHHIDRASPKIYDACCSGKHLNHVRLEVCRSGGKKLKYLEIQLEQVLISGVQIQGNPDVNGFPHEILDLSYGKIRWIYTQQKRADGSGGGNISAGWDLTSNRSIA
jgi:type VI secretion system secreted protein Hcp